MLPAIPDGWRMQLEEEVGQPYFQELQQFLEADRKKFQVYPPEADTPRRSPRNISWARNPFRRSIGH